MTIDAITAVTAAAQAKQPEGLSINTNNTGDFSNLIAKGVAQLDASVKTADKSITDYILNKDVSTHELMIAMEKAKHHLGLAVEVRNRLSEAYSTITRMQV